MQNTVFSFFTEQSSLLLQQTEKKPSVIRNRGVSAALDLPLMPPHETRSEWVARLGCSDQHSANTVIRQRLRTQSKLPALWKRMRLSKSKALHAKFQYNYHRTWQMCPQLKKTPYPLSTEDISRGGVPAPQNDTDDSYERYVSQLADIANDWTFAVSVASCTPESLSKSKFEEFIDFLFTELVNRPRFHCESKDEHAEFVELLKYPPDKSSTTVDPIKDIIMPNVLCALLLEAKYATLDKPEALTLKKFLSDYSRTEHDEYMASRYSLAKYPDAIKQLLGISKKGAYEIKPLFPELLVALIDSQGDLPFHKGPRVTNWEQNRSFLKNCLEAIENSSKGAVDSYVSYYLIELIFRLNTKCRLFLRSKQTKQKDMLSPQVLADIFYSSPLVYIPDEYISQCAYSKEYLHAFIQLSYYWFPVIQTALRHYFKENAAFHCRTIDEYLLPMCGTIDVPKSKSMADLTDREERDYNKAWADFVPPKGYHELSSYDMYTISDWEEMMVPKSLRDPDDCETLESI